MSRRVLRRRKPTKRVGGGKLRAAVILGSRGGKHGGPARARALSPGQRSRIAAMGGRARMKRVKSRVTNVKNI